MSAMSRKALGLLFPLLCCVAQSQAAPSRPNVLLIVADDLGFSDTSPFGGEISTPSLQGLADEGVRLTNFYAGPTCSVSRSMLLTGVDNHQAGLGTMAEYLQPEQKGKPGYEGQLNRRVATLAELLRDVGYNTFMTGKWHLGATPESNAAARGFERSYTLMPGGASHMDKTQMFPGNYKARYLEDGKDVSIPDDFYSSDFYTDRLLGYLERDRQPGKPFFAYLAFTAPHWPLQAPDEYLDRYRGNYADGYEALRRKRLARMIELGILPAGTRPNDPLADKLPTWEQLSEAQRQEQTRIMQIYAAMVDNMDHNIGRVLEHLRKSGELDNTFILFMSDNGPESASPESLGTTEDRNGIRDWVDATFDNSPRNMGRKGSYVTLGPGWAQVGATPFPYFKSFTAKGGIQVPAIVRYPAATAKGAISGEVMHVKDFVPTILALAGAGYPAQYRGQPLLPLQGRSMLPVLRGQAQPARVLGWEFNGRRALYKGQWAAQMQKPPYGSGRWELYDLARDPAFNRDLAASEPEKAAELAADWDDYARDNGVVPAPIRYKYGQMTCLYSHCIQ
ncbi:arylsulfatase [Pseudomonas aeruginosa]|uniref:arylsulfatase n=1 Tax=Pseudomonas aeruginosa TaxID=287 RepID=UPI000DEF497B|nr:arylsulfatase [Pseudomonas aeruginosa]EJB8383520.1 arylsulfatase [Pseudomonas aeruginosa]MBG4982857.1 arylsulfatase [Pseudomonas aeruginosa]MBG6832246.1 arylsulfatase [Pseudomonas aeruginosa]MBG7460877.1 arylsulfatase [Pseudomonas aeruginosa]MBO2833704.1 arylsulfatase [Pseudomonas aeruginosa]